jgi:glycosyltransferase involved in cell wall biosynthesis
MAGVPASGVSPFCSVVIPTIGRPTLARAVSSVFAQTTDPMDVEAVVVNDSGVPLADTSWIVEGRTRVITTTRRERSVARNAGAAMARGRYLCFLDDDDWLLPEAWEHFRRLAQDSGSAAWLYGGIRVVDGTGQVLGEANSGLSGNCVAQVVGGAWVPLQASLVRADLFFQVGGFNPFICGTEDLDLCRRIALIGEFANTPATVGCLFRGDTWQTSTDYGRAADDTRRSRDGIFDEPGALSRAVKSAKAASDSAYWFGRLSRAYFSTVHFNLQQKHFFTATSRALSASAVACMAGRRAFSSRYWQGLRAHHVPGSLHFIPLR